MRFNVGDRVWWWSRGGAGAMREGRVVAVVPARKHMRLSELRRTHRIMFRNLDAVRNHESYLVEVVGSTLRSAPRLYHPRTADLQRMEGVRGQPL